MKDLVELTTTANVATWTPTEDYADLVIEAAVAHSELQGIVTVNGGFDKDANEGRWLTFQLAPARTAQTPGPNGCLSQASSSMTTAAVQIEAYGDYDAITAMSIWAARPQLVSSIRNEMSKGLAKKWDEEIWDALTPAGDGSGGGLKATHNISLGSAIYRANEQRSHPFFATASEASQVEVYGDSVNIYEAIVDSVASMRGQGYNPDYAIMHPTVAAVLKWRSQFEVPYDQITIGKDGVLKNIAGIPVIECGNANIRTKTSSTTLIAVIDSSRAVGEAWGMRPTFSVDYNNQCNRYEHALWAWWGTGIIDRDAIFHIKNP